STRKPAVSKTRVLTFRRISGRLCMGYVAVDGSSEHGGNERDGHLCVCDHRFCGFATNEVDASGGPVCSSQAVGHRDSCELGHGPVARLGARSLDKAL